jgi:integrase
MSIHRRRTKNGHWRYQVRWREGGRSGRNYQATFDTKRDAETFETARRRAKQLGQLSGEVLGSEEPFGEFASEWWETYARVRLKPSTRVSYAYQLDRWIIPFLGEIPLRALTRATLDNYVAELISANAGAPTVNRCLAITRGILQRALEWGRIATNPAIGVAHLRHARDAGITAHTAEAVELIRGNLDAGDAALVSVLAYEALRPGEAFALQWRDVLDEAGRPRERLRIERALSDHELALTKSNRARAPELFAPVGEELAELYLVAGSPERHSLVFPDSRGGYLRRQNWRKRAWLPALRRANPCPACQATGASAGSRCQPCKGTGAANYFRP